MNPPETPDSHSTPTFWPKRGFSLTLLLLSSLLSFADRYVLGSVVPGLRQELFGHPENYSAPTKFFIHLLQPLLGSNPENAMIGLLSMAFMVAYIIFSPIFSSLGLKRWIVIGIGVMLWSFASGASGLALTFDALLITRCFVGIGEAAFGPIAPTMIADMYSSKVRAQAMSVFNLATPVGCALGFAVGGIFVGTSLGWRWAFFVFVPAGILLGIVCLFQKDYATPSKSAAKYAKLSFRQRMAEYRVFFKNKTFVYNLFANSALTFAIGGIGFWMPSYILEYRHEGSPAQVNLMFGGILIVAGIIGTMWGGRVSDKYNQKNPMAYSLVPAWSMMGVLPASILMLYVPFPWAWLFLAFAAFFLYFNAGPCAAIIANVVPEELRAGAFAVSILVTHALGDVISPFVIGAIADGTHGNMNIAFLAVSATVAIGGALWFIAAKHLQADTEAVQIAEAALRQKEAQAEAEAAKALTENNKGNK